MRAPVLAVGDGALGFWGALREVFPDTRAQRCWVHKVANVINALPTSVQPTARRMLAEIRDAEDRGHAVTAINAFASEFGAKWSKAVAKIIDDVEPLLAFYDFPAEHWVHLKTTNPIESTSRGYPAIEDAGACVLSASLSDGRSPTRDVPAMSPTAGPCGIAARIETRPDTYRLVN
jgi:transposase-like protein